MTYNDCVWWDVKPYCATTILTTAHLYKLISVQPPGSIHFSSSSVVAPLDHPHLRLLKSQIVHFDMYHPTFGVNILLYYVILIPIIPRTPPMLNCSLITIYQSLHPSLLFSSTQNSNPSFSQILLPLRTRDCSIMVF